MSIVVYIAALAMFWSANAWAEEKAEGERGISTVPSEPASEGQTGEIEAGKVREPLRKVLPGLPPVAQERLLNLPRIAVREIRVEGNTVVPAEFISSITSEYEGKAIDAEALHELRYRLSKLYVEHGFVNTGVIMPDQKVTDGVVRLQAIEGRITAIDINNPGRLRDSYVAKRIESGVTTPLNVVDLQNVLRKVQLDQRINVVNARLVPGVNPGESVLKVDVAETNNFWFELGADNHRSPSVDENRGFLSLGHNNVTGNGDALTAAIGLTEGLDDFSVGYAMPLTRNDMLFNAYYSETDSTIVEAPFDQIDIASNSESWGISLRQPFGSFAASLGFEKKRSENWLLGIPFSFSPGEVDGQSEASIVWLAGEWIRRSETGALAVRGAVRKGIDALDATINSDDPDGRFEAYSVQIQYARKLKWRNAQFIASGAAQHAPDPLLAFEKFAIGGIATVRGYRENQYVRDNGVTLSAELSFPLFLDDDGQDPYKLELVPFIDGGVVWDTDNLLPSADKDELYSIGLGVRWRPLPGLSLNVSYGHALHDVDNPNDTLQDRGFNFQLTYALFR